jgi:hypothetical protein
VLFIVMPFFSSWLGMTALVGREVEVTVSAVRELWAICLPLETHKRSTQNEAHFGDPLLGRHSSGIEGMGAGEASAHDRYRPRAI